MCDCQTGKLLVSMVSAQVREILKNAWKKAISSSLRYVYWAASKTQCKFHLQDYFHCHYLWLNISYCIALCFCNIRWQLHAFLRSALFWDITQRRVVILYRRFGTIYRPHLQESRSTEEILSLGFLTLENGNERISWNVGTELPLYAA
jgi:hypothetical protein